MAHQLLALHEQKQRIGLTGVANAHELAFHRHAGRSGDPFHDFGLDIKKLTNPAVHLIGENIFARLRIDQSNTDAQIVPIILLTSLNDETGSGGLDDFANAGGGVAKLET